MSTSSIAIVDHNTGFLLYLSEKESREAAVSEYMELVEFYVGGPLRAIELSDDQACQIAEWWGDESMTIAEWMAQGEKFDYPSALRGGVMYSSCEISTIASISAQAAAEAARFCKRFTMLTKATAPSPQP